VVPAYRPPAKPARPLRASKPADKRGWWWGTGRRKTSVARVRLRPAKDGPGKLVVHREDKKTKTIEEYFAEERDRNDCYAPLKATNTDGKFEVIIRSHGGGPTGQAQAIKLGLARALLGYDPTLETVLRDQGMLTRDAREVERKKYGQSGARRRFQFSKR
jgi:small subunit ribosomal protein S9